MTGQHEPPRWLDDPNLASELRGELSAIASDGPVLQRRARMFSALEAELGLAATATPSSEPATVGSGLGKLKLVLGSAALVGALGLLFALSTRPAAVPTQPKRVVSPAAQPSTPELPIAAPAVEIVQEVPVVPALQLPSPVVRRRARAPSLPPSVALVPETKPEPVSTRADVVAELALLARARRALLNNPAHTLEFTEVHARDFPRGTFGEEREVLAIQALYRLGLADEARQRATRFEQQFPSSAHRAHLTRMMMGLER
jgi:hypothetical protein